MICLDDCFIWSMMSTISLPIAQSKRRTLLEKFIPDPKNNRVTRKWRGSFSSQAQTTYSNSGMFIGDRHPHILAGNHLSGNNFLADNQSAGHVTRHSRIVATDAADRVKWSHSETVNSTVIIDVHPREKKPSNHIMQPQKRAGH